MSPAPATAPNSGRWSSPANARPEKIANAEPAWSTPNDPARRWYRSLLLREGPAAQQLLDLLRDGVQFVGRGRSP
jgi:hypothetical protein